MLLIPKSAKENIYLIKSKESIEKPIISNKRILSSLKPVKACSNHDSILNKIIRNGTNNFTHIIKDCNKKNLDKYNNIEEFKDNSKDKNIISKYIISNREKNEDIISNYNKYKKITYYGDGYQYMDKLFKQVNINKEIETKENINSFKTNISNLDSSKIDNVKSNNYFSKNIRKIVKNENNNYNKNINVNYKDEKKEMSNNVLNKHYIQEKPTKTHFYKNYTGNNYLPLSIKENKNIIVNKREEEYNKKKRYDKHERINVPQKLYNNNTREKNGKIENENDKKKILESVGDNYKKNDEKKFVKEQKYKDRLLDKTKQIQNNIDLERKIRTLENENQLLKKNYDLLENELNNKIQSLVKENQLQKENYTKLNNYLNTINDKTKYLNAEKQKLQQIIKENQEKLDENLNKIKCKDNEINVLKEKDNETRILLNEKNNQIKEFENIIKNNNNEIFSLKEKEKEYKLDLCKKDNKIKELENIIKNINNKIYDFDKNEKKNQSLLNEKDNKINELEKLIKHDKDKISIFEENEKQNKILLIETEKKLKNYDLLIKDYKNKNLILIEKENNLNSLLNENINRIKEYEFKIQNNSDKINALEEKEKESQIIFVEKDNKINNLESIIKKNNNEISSLKKQIKEISDNNKNEIDQYKIKINQLEIIIKQQNNINENKKNIVSEKEFIQNGNTNSNSKQESKQKDKNNNSEKTQKKDDDGINNFNNKEINEKKISNKDLKIYGFINHSNDCYLNSSLQLLTRIKELKNGIYNYEKKYKINEDNDTQGELFIELKKIFNKIEKSNNDGLIIDPKDLKNAMGKLDEKYYENNQEDANEFISNLIDGLVMETSNKLKEKELDKLKTLKINDELVKTAYDNFFTRFFIKSGYSFLFDIFYGILLSKKYCKGCREEIIKFNPYSMLELPIYQLAKKNKNKSLELNQILNEFKSEKKYESKCKNCNSSKNMYTKTLLYTYPKYLIICFGRTLDNEYIYNNILYEENLELISDYDNKIYKYSLECVLEHSGGMNYGHYTALCPKDKENNRWYRFSDSYCDKFDNNFHSKCALILLYKLFQ